MRNQKIYLNTALMVIVLCLRIHISQCRSNLNENVKISKCCPLGSELKVNTTVEQDVVKTEYECTLSEGNETFFGYNLHISDGHIPDCDVELFNFDVDGDLISSNGCIDMYDGTLHGLTCSGNMQVEVHKLFKCCAKGRINCSFFTNKHKLLYPLNDYSNQIFDIEINIQLIFSELKHYLHKYVKKSFTKLLFAHYRIPHSL